MNATCFTFPSSAPGQAAWVADPSCRGTFNIALLCLSTTIICIWSSVHRDIPLERLSAFRSLLRDAPLVLVALFAPELMFYFALNQYICARDVVRFVSSLESPKALSNDGQGSSSQVRKLLRIFGLQTAASHYQYDDAEMLLHRAQDTNGTSRQQSERNRQNQFTLVHGYYATMGGFTYTEPVGFFNHEPRREKLTANGVKFFMKYEPDLIPAISLTSVNDRSKSNSLGKALLVVQVFWFCLNCASRLAERLPLSLLEVSALAHGLFTLSSYAMWWSKPLSIDEPTEISMEDVRASEAYALVTIASLGHWGDSKEYDSLKDAITGRPLHLTLYSPILIAAWNAAKRYRISPKELSTIRDKFYLPTSSETVPSFSSLFQANGFETLSSYLRDRVTDYTVTTCIPFIYGFLHFLALRAQFPTMVERVLWHIASVVVMSSGAFNALFEVIKDVCMRGLVSSRSLIIVFRGVDIINYRIIPFFYLIASGYLLVESIRQLWYLPHDAYVVASWSYYIPHWL